jgi:peptidyl-prolyl cis-trans isomerase A (cyclophilin A)
MTTLTRVSLCAALGLALAGCKKDKKDDGTKPVEGSGTTMTGSGSGTTDSTQTGSGSGTTMTGSGSGTTMTGSGSGGGGTSEPDTSHDTVREPTAEDLAVYMKNLPGEGDKLLAEIKTSEGTLHCELFPKAAMTVANFIGLATGQKAWADPRTGDTRKDTPFFDGLRCHRVVQGFMMQCGDPLGNGTGGPGYAMDQEPYPDLLHEPGTLSMANTGRPHSSGSQFFIMEERNKGLDGGYSVFGKCKEVDVIKKATALQSTAMDPRGRREEVPTKTITIDKVTISKGK